MHRDRLKPVRISLFPPAVRPGEAYFGADGRTLGGMPGKKERRVLPETDDQSFFSFEGRGTSLCPLVPLFHPLLLLSLSWGFPFGAGDDEPSSPVFPSFAGRRDVGARLRSWRAFVSLRNLGHRAARWTSGSKRHAGPHEHLFYHRLKKRPSLGWLEVAALPGKLESFP